MRVAFPSRAISLLLGIGLIDLISTAWLYHCGEIVEMNPLMRFFLARGEWAFVAVKGVTLLAAWAALASYTKVNRAFVRRSCLIGAASYVTLWIVWFGIGSLR